jgi:hypothetical protein
MPTQEAANAQRWPREEITVADQSTLDKTARSTVVGNFTEWYDFAFTAS